VDHALFASVTKVLPDWPFPFSNYHATGLINCHVGPLLAKPAWGLVGERSARRMMGAEARIFSPLRNFPMENYQFRENAMPCSVSLRYCSGLSVDAPMYGHTPEFDSELVTGNT
jgi:hypothetical protein